MQKLSPNDGTVVGAFSKNCVLIKHVSASAPLKMYLWQSSSATTSIVVAMAASGAITLREGIPVIMGSNVGTSVTSTMVGTIAISTDNPAIYTNIYLFLITTQYLPISTYIPQCTAGDDGSVGIISCMSIFSACFGLLTSRQLAATTWSGQIWISC